MDLTPNPADDMIFIHLNKVATDGKMLTVYDQLGRVVLSKRIRENMQDFNLDLPTELFSSGRYFIQVVSGQATLTKTLVIVR